LLTMSSATRGVKVRRLPVSCVLLGAQAAKGVGMATIEVTVCDVCRNPDRGSTQFHITEGDRTSTVDLCDEHAAPMRGLLKHGCSVASPPGRDAARAPISPGRASAVADHAAPVRRRRTRFDAQVATMDEIETRKLSQ